MVTAEVGHLEGRQVRSALVYCLDVDLTVSVLVPVGFLFHDVKLDVGGKAAEGFPVRSRSARPPISPSFGARKIVNVKEAGCFFWGLSRQAPNDAPS